MTKKERWLKDKEFYLQIWEAQPHRCQVTGKWLGDEPLSTFFHHVLPKTRFPQYRWCRWNIAILHPEVHAQVEIDMDKVPEIRRLYEDLLEGHRNGELLNCD